MHEKGGRVGVLILSLLKHVLSVNNGTFLSGWQIVCPSLFLSYSKFITLLTNRSDFLSRVDGGGIGLCNITNWYDRINKNCKKLLN